MNGKILHLHGFQLVALAVLIASCACSEAQVNAPTDQEHRRTQAIARERAEAALRHAQENLVNQKAASYTRIFTELGLTPEQEDQFKAKLADLHRKAIAAGEPMQELGQARVDYDEQIRAALGPEKYLRYREFEESKPARRELELIREFAAKSNHVAIGATDAAGIVELVKRTKATTTEEWHGPYDPMPHPEVGLERLVVVLGQKVARLRQVSSNLVEALPKSGVPVTYHETLKAYYAWKILEKEQQLAFYSLPKEEIMRRQLEESRKRVEELRLKGKAYNLEQPF